MLPGTKRESIIKIHKRIINIRKDRLPWEGNDRADIQRKNRCKRNTRRVRRMCSQHKNDLEAHRDQTMQGQYSMARGLIFIQRTMARYCSIKTKEKMKQKRKNLSLLQKDDAVVTAGRDVTKWLRAPEEVAFVILVENYWASLKHIQGGVNLK